MSRRNIFFLKNMSRGIVFDRAFAVQEIPTDHCSRTSRLTEIPSAAPRLDGQLFQQRDQRVGNFPAR
jgi:hypothetical protein